MECVRINANELRIKVSENELKILDNFKNEMLYLLDDYKETCISIIDNHLHPYLNDYAKMNELQKMNKDAFEEPGFEVSFLNVITLNYPKVEFLNDDLFLKFAWFTNLIDDDQIAISKIKDYLLIHFINFYLKEYENGGLNAQKIVFKFPEIKELKGGLKSDYNSLVFDKPESEDFFIYLVENWLKNEVHKTTALRFIFTEMWYNTPEKETPYKITSTQTYFAREYWNKKYSILLKLHPKNPKLKDTDINNDYYCKRFKNLLTEFKGG